MIYAIVDFFSALFDWAMWAVDAVFGTALNALFGDPKNDDP